jgi:hypothetical protein
MRLRKRAIVLAGGLIAAGGAVFAALPGPGRPAESAVAAPAERAIPAPSSALPIVEARWTTEPVRVTRQDLPRLAPVVREAPPVEVAAIETAPAVPLPPPRPPECRERAPAEQDRAFLRDWCATANDAVHVCPLIRDERPRRAERPVRNVRGERGVRVVTIAGPRRVQAQRPSYDSLVRNQLALMER